MNKLCVRISIIAVALTVIPALAASKAKAPQKQVIDFEALTIDGKLKKPEGLYIMDRKELKFKRLLNLDESFIKNIIKSIDEF